MDERRKLLREQCDREGVSGARGLLEMVRDDFQRACILEWIDEYERGESAKRELAQRDQNERAIQAAMLSAETSREAAVAAKWSAFWTMVAAIVAAASALISLWQAFRQTGS
jgi:hypothetical protein